MSIIQISKIQQRSGELVDLPQLDEAEFGFASDTKQLFIGKEDPNENIEVLTAYSEISFSQIEGSNSNVNITDSTLANGQIFTYNGSDWVNRGGNAGGLITLGDVSNVKIDGGAISYVLTTDGVGNLSWTPKGVIDLDILTVSANNPGRVTLTSEFGLVNGTEVTINGVIGNTGFDVLNGNTFFLKTVPGSLTEYDLYTDLGLTTTYDTSALTPLYPYTSATATDSSSDAITVANSVPFANTNPIIFLGNLGNSGLQANTTYYVCDVPNATAIIVGTTSDGNIGNKVNLTTTSITANAYVPGGKVIAIIDGSTGTAAGGATTSIQYNVSGIITGDANFVWQYTGARQLTVLGNANIGNVTINSTGGIGTVTANILISNIATGTAPLTVSSTTRVSNLNVAYSNVTDFSVVTTQTTGTFYPTFVNGLTGNYALGANANLSFNAATGNLSATLLTGTLTTTSQPNITSVGTLSTLTVTGNANVGNMGATRGVFTNIVGTLETASQPNITSLGSLTSLTVTGNANVGNLGTAGLIVVTGNITGGNLTTGGRLNVTGNANVGNIGATAGVFSANVTAGNVYANSGTVGASLLSGTLTTSAQPNITSVGTLSSLAVTANITAGNVYANSGTIGAGLLAGTLSTPAQPNVTSVGTLSSLSVTGNVTAGNFNTTSGTVGGSSATLFGVAITTGANTTAGTITGNWTLTSGSRLQSTYADLAEYYCADGHYTIGTVLEFGGEQEVTIAGNESSKIAGVVSDQPAYVMNSNIQCEYPVPVALIGRVPCKVKGKVRKGDMLVSAGEGFAKVNSITPKIGSVIGKALADFDGVEGVIEIVVGRL